MVQYSQWANDHGSMSRKPESGCLLELGPTLDGLIDHEEQVSRLNKSSACLKKINSSQFARFSKRERVVTAKFGLQLAQFSASEAIEGISAKIGTVLAARSGQRRSDWLVRTFSLSPLIKPSQPPTVGSLEVDRYEYGGTSYNI